MWTFHRLHAQIKVLHIEDFWPSSGHGQFPQMWSYMVVVSHPTYSFYITMWACGANMTNVNTTIIKFSFACKVVSRCEAYGTVCAHAQKLMMLLHFFLNPDMPEGDL